jgi:hypothetical protein
MARNFLRCLLASIVFAHSYISAPSQTAKITRIKLEDYGWEPLPNGDYHEHRGAFSLKLWIDHKGRVLVGFTVRKKFTLATRGHPGRSFHILRFGSEGKPDLSEVLPTNNWYNNGFYLSPEDQILARANDMLQFLQDDSHKPGEAWLPLVPCPVDCLISQSFSRRTLILRVQPPAGGPDSSTYTILDLSSSPPRVVRTCSQMAFYAGRITDKFAYWPHYDRDNYLMVRFPFCDVDHYEEFPKLGRGASGFVLNDETVLKVSPYLVKLVGVDGQVKFSQDLPKHDSLNVWEVTTDERFDRFAFMVNTERGEHPRLDIGGHLVARRALVLDERGKTVASIPADTNYNMDSDFSMSPDGRRLAILDEGVLTIAQLE